MSIRGRAIVGALLFFGGLLIAVGAGVYKSSDRIRYEHNVEKQAGDQTPPSGTGPNVLLILGALAALGGVALIGLTAREMLAQIGAASAGAEAKMQRELLDQRDPKPKPKPPT
jgi:hypothetical protein